MVTGAVVAGLLASTMPAPVSARVVTTEEALSATPASDRAALDALLARDDVRAQFEALGVDPAQARERVQALDDQQVRELAARLDQLPAGAGVLGVIFAIFVILLVTDILGLTKVFPFTRSVR
jgi:hypothetical protein